MPRVWCIWSSSGRNGQRNLQHGLTTTTWGLKKRPHGGQPHQGDYVLFGMNISGPNARLLERPWAQANATLILGEINSPLYRGTSWHWEDEQAQRQVLYPHRFGFAPIGRAEQVSLAAAGPLGPNVTEALRLSVSRNQAVLGTGSLTPLLQVMGINTSPAQSGQAGAANLSATLPPPEATAGNGHASGRPGRTNDPVLRRVIEEHAVAVAKRHMQSEHGWARIKDLGKPYDLVCMNGSLEKHVEVKGTTGAGGSVEYTSNEVHHFRNCPHGADLIVVREIQIDHSTTPPTASEGRLLHIPDYRAPQADLQPTRFNGRVIGW